MHENDSTGSDDPRRAELLRRRAEVAQRLAIARANLGELQEDALMLVPRPVLPLVNGGTAADFRSIHAQMTDGLMADMDSMVESIDRPTD